jgi:uncharacterized protein
MVFEWDEAKRAANLQKHGIDFTAAEEMFSRPIVIIEDSRRPYSEVRNLAFGIVQGRVLVAAFTHRGKALRLISMRKANVREQKYFFKALQDRLETR